MSSHPNCSVDGLRIKQETLLALKWALWRRRRCLGASVWERTRRLDAGGAGPGPGRGGRGPWRGRPGRLAREAPRSPAVSASRPRPPEKRRTRWCPAAHGGRGTLVPPLAEVTVLADFADRGRKEKQASKAGRREHGPSAPRGRQGRMRAPRPSPTAFVPSPARLGLGQDSVHRSQQSAHGGVRRVTP